MGRRQEPNSLSNASPLRCRLPPYSTSVHHLSCRHSRKQILLRSLSENSPAAKMVRYWHKMMSAKSYFPHFSSSAYIICVWDSQFKNGLTHIYSPPTFKEQSKQNRKKFCHMGVPRTFVGASITTCHGEKLNDEIKLRSSRIQHHLFMSVNCGETGTMKFWGIIVAFIASHKWFEASS